jgi:replication-associated recombination protein RarA
MTRPRATRGGYALDEVVSALQKSIRRADEDQAMYWALELMESGYAQYMWKRLGVIAAEEVGLADGGWGVVLVDAALRLFERRVDSWSKGPYTHELLGMAILYLSRAPKSSEAGMAAYAVSAERKAGRWEDVPDYALDGHTARGREIAREQGLSPNQQTADWYRIHSFKKPIKRGNAWIRRCLEAAGVTDPQLLQELISEQYAAYSETEEGQHPPLTTEEEAEPC